MAQLHSWPNVVGATFSAKTPLRPAAVTGQHVVMNNTTHMFSFAFRQYQFISHLFSFEGHTHLYFRHI